MRIAILFAVLLLASTVSAATTSVVQGTQPAVFGDIVAFLTFEDAIDKDLNNDGDMSDHVIQYYDLAEQRVTNTGNTAEQLALAGKLIAYEDKKRAIQFYDVEEKKGDGTQERGTAPSVHGNIIAFTTSEKDAAEDLNDDGDQTDDIIRYYDTSKDELTNTKAVGTDPLALSDIIAFTTREDAAGEDLNDDGDRDDTIIRYVNVDDDDIINTELTGEQPVGYTFDTIIVTDNDLLAVVKLLKKEKTMLPVFGNDPSFSQDLLVYERDNTLFTYRLSTGVEKSLALTGAEPALFERTLAFIDAEKKIAVIQGEDPDQDSIPDFADNCPDAANTKQEDADKDGVGDACDAAATPAAPVAPPPAEFTTQAVVEPPAAPPVEALPEPPAERKSLPETTVLQKEKEDRNPTYWFLIAVGLLVIGLFLFLFVPRWMQKRRKSYGF